MSSTASLVSFATAVNQESQISQLGSISYAVQLSATETTAATIAAKLEEMRLLLVYPHNTYYTEGLSVTPDDTDDLSVFYSALSVNFDGNVKLQLQDNTGSSFITVYLRAGVIYPFKVRKVFATDTTATGITVWR